jgi:hypothetical protein
MLPPNDHDTTHRTLTICGMTPPPLRTATVHPTPTPESTTRRMLCSDARATAAPETVTGSKWATGVTRPERPICSVIAVTGVGRKVAVWQDGKVKGRVSCRL